MLSKRADDVVDHLARPPWIALHTLDNDRVCEGAFSLQVRQVLRLGGLILSHVGTRAAQHDARECRRFRRVAFTWVCPAWNTKEKGGPKPAQKVFVAGRQPRRKFPGHGAGGEPCASLGSEPYRKRSSVVRLNLCSKGGAWPQKSCGRRRRTPRPCPIKTSCHLQRRCIVPLAFL